MSRSRCRRTWWATWRPTDKKDGRCLSLYKGVAIAIEVPQSVTVEVAETEPAVKGQTAASSYKPALLSNGVEIKVPPHIGAGTRIVINTEDGAYVERAKD